MTTDTGMTAAGTIIEAIGAGTDGAGSRPAAKPSAVATGNAIITERCSTDMGMIIATSMIIAIIGADDHSCRDRPTALNTPWTTGRVVDARVVRMPLNPPIEVGPDGLARVELRIEATDRMVATYALSVTFEAENGDSIKANTFLIDM